jgi:gluconolactonase
MRILICLFLTSFLACSPSPKEPTTQPTAMIHPTLGEIIVKDQRLLEVLDPNTPIEILAEGYVWSEGPLWLEKQQKLIWSDVPQNTIFQWKEGEGASVFLKPSGYTGDIPRGGEPGSNGLVLDPEGRLVLCQHGDRRMARMDAPLDDPTPSFTTLADQFDGKRFNSPNDAAYGPQGYLYFTDPPYGLVGNMDDPTKEIPFQGVFRVSPEGEVSLMTDELSRPNGIAFSPDFSKCYVANSDPERAIWMVYELDEQLAFTNGRVFYDVTDQVGSAPGLPDGLKINREGILFATGPGGVLIFSPEGEHLGTISTGQGTANCALNTDESVLYITADMYVCSVRLKS